VRELTLANIDKLMNLIHKIILLVISTLAILSCNNQNNRKVIKDDAIIQKEKMLFSTYSDSSDFQREYACGCESNQENLDCDTIILSNNAMLYWKINCDFASYCFENNNRITYLKTSSDFELIERIGLTFIKEYKDYLFFVDELISGCCTPPDIVFLNKYDASEINRIPSSQFVYENIEKDYVTYFQDDKLTKFIFHNLKTNTRKMTVIEEGLILNSIQNNKALYISDVLSLIENDKSIKLELNITSDSRKIINIKSW
jgi:hypothetical protein